MTIKQAAHEAFEPIQKEIQRKLKEERDESKQKSMG
jgi:hypothetical protein